LFIDFHNFYDDVGFLLFSSYCRSSSDFFNNLSYSEALIIGISCSALLVQISVIENLSNWIIETIPLISLNINSEALKTVISSLVCVVMFGVFVVLYESSTFIKIIPSGAGFLAPTLLMLILFLITLED
jgi:hypothetical protein